MRKVLLVTDHSNRFLQKKHRFDSLDIQKLADGLAENHQVEITSFAEIVNSGKTYSGYDIIYTGSQMPMYKNYIEDIMYHLNENNNLIPSFEILKSHENKFFQELQNRKLGIDTNIPAYLFGDIHEYQAMFEGKDERFPLVIKGISGSASMNVKIVRSYAESIEAIKEIDANMVAGMNADMPKQYDLFPAENNMNRQIVVQEFIELPNYDYRVHVMGDRYYGHKRTLCEGSEYASGSGSINDFNCELSDGILNYAKEQFEKLDTPHIIFDIVEKEDGYYLIEWSGLHLGCVSLLNAERYYHQVNGEWQRVENKHPELEAEYVHAFNTVLNEK